MKDTLILKDGTTIGLEMGAELNNVRIISEDKTSMVNVWSRFTADNLSEVAVKNGDGMTVGNYTDIVLVSETSIVQEDGKILTSFCLREKTEIERLRDEIEILKEGQVVQDGAIMDVAEVVSAIAEAQEGGQ